MCAFEDCFRTPKNGHKYCGSQKIKDSCAYKALLKQNQPKKANKHTKIPDDIKAAYDYWSC